MHATAFPLPTNQLFRRQAKRDHRELEVEPVWLEPEEEIDTKNNGKRSETQSVRVAPRPTEQHVERVCEQELGDDEVTGGVDLRPIPSPIQQHRNLRAGLQVVLLSQDHIDGER